MKQLLYKRPSELFPYFKNPRKNEDAVVAVAESIQAFGFQSPILADEKFEIIAGHTRWKAALKLELKEVPVVTTDELSESKKRAYRIADNKYGEKSEWDFALLKDEIEELDTGEFDIEITGFFLDEIEELMTKYGDEFQGNTDDDAIPEDVETRCKSGDIWLLGRHRLMCGDATNKDDVERLMDGKKSNCILTDPPYNVDYSSKNELLNSYDKGNKIQTPIKGDHINPEDYADFTENWIMSVLGFMTEYNAIYIFGNYEIALTVYYKNLFKISNILVWVKNNAVLGRMDYNGKHENILYGWNGKHKFYGNGSANTVWDVDKPLKNDLHPTMKPIDLLIIPINNSSLREHIILDPFLGSGSTLIACEKTNRICYGMEIDPRYCDVIIQRWEDYTGEKAVKSV